MNKRIDTLDIVYPVDDIDCWEKYPKHRWVYDLSRLLDAQNIKWSPYKSDLYPDKELNLDLFSSNPIVIYPGFIYVKKPNATRMISELYVIKGEIKHTRLINSETGAELNSLIGEIELRVSAFITLYFQKFTGIMVIESLANEIFRIRLRPQIDINCETNQEIIKLVKRIYKKNDTTYTTIS